MTESKKMHADEDHEDGMAPETITGTWAVVFKNGAVVELEKTKLKVFKSPSGTTIGLTRGGQPVSANSKTGWGLDPKEIAGYLRIG